MEREALLLSNKNVELRWSEIVNSSGVCCPYFLNKLRLEGVPGWETILSRQIPFLPKGVTILIRFNFYGLRY
jgi:hypothetical protein